MAKGAPKASSDFSHPLAELTSPTARFKAQVEAG